jgi:Uma2 family endonuclease
MPKNPPHTLVNGLIHEAIARLLPAGWFADSQEPITTDDSEPEPDVRVVRGERRAFRERHPGPRDIGLVVEVSDATLERDRKLKKQLYGRAGISVYWIVNLRERRLEVYTEPSGPAAKAGYGRRQDFGPGDVVPVTLDGVEVGRLAVDDLLP